MNKLPVLIFDLDGTLVHTLPRMIDAFHQLVAEHTSNPLLTQFMSTRQRREEFIPDAKPTILRLHESGYRLARLTKSFVRCGERRL